MNINNRFFNLQTHIKLSLYLYLSLPVSLPVSLPICARGNPVCLAAICISVYLSHCLSLCVFGMDKETGRETNR